MTPSPAPPATPYPLHSLTHPGQVGQLEFQFYHHWFDLMFLGAAALTLLAFTLRRATSRRLHAGWKRHLARATARHPCLLGPHGGLSVALCILEESGCATPGCATQSPI